MHWPPIAFSGALAARMPAQGPIDVVYTWVDGHRPDYQALVQRYSREPVDANPERFRDVCDMLRYSLRSLERYAPWVRNVYLFTCRPHVPAWLRRDHPRLRVVHHDEVVTEPDFLPMFNSNVIESYLSRLPGLSDRFLYFNDDYFLGAPTTRHDFETHGGAIKVFGTVCGERLRWRVYQQQIVSLGLLEHGPLYVVRSEWDRALADAAEDVAELRRHRFRQPDDLRVDRLYRWHLLARGHTPAIAEPFWRYLQYAMFVKVRRHPARERKAFARLERLRPRFFCLNDDQGPAPNPEVMRLMRGFLDRYFPDPSSFELPGA